MKKAYFARPITSYGNKTDLKDIDAIQSIGFQVLDITTPEIQQRYPQEGMDLFKGLVAECDALFFRSFVGGGIGKGVKREIDWAKDIGLPVFEIPTGIEARTLSVEQTRESLKELGR